MRARAHAPQSWSVSPDADVYLDADESKIIAWCAEPHSIRNAHLIAAAPELLSVLQEIRGALDGDTQRVISDELAEKVNAAIDKAVVVHQAQISNRRQ